MAIATFPATRLRGALAEARITHRRLAAASGINPCFISHILSGRQQPGALTVLRLQRGLARLGVHVPDVEAIDPLEVEESVDVA